MRSYLAMVIGALAGLVLACGDGSPTPPAAEGVPATDEQYLAAICTHLERLTDALVSPRTADEVRAAIQRFADDLRRLTPPADLIDFHRKFIAYLDSAVERPLDVLTRRPPLPEESVRRRLAAKELSVAECRRPTFFQRTEGTTAKP